MSARAWPLVQVRSDVSYLILDFIRCERVEKNENPTAQFLGMPANGDDDPGMSLLILKIPARQSLKVHPVVRQNGFPLAGGEG